MAEADICRGQMNIGQARVKWPLAQIQYSAVPRGRPSQCAGLRRVSEPASRIVWRWDSSGGGVGGGDVSLRGGVRMGGCCIEGDDDERFAQRLQARFELEGA